MWKNVEKCGKMWEMWKWASQRPSGSGINRPTVEASPVTPLLLTTDSSDGKNINAYIPKAAP